MRTSSPMALASGRTLVNIRVLVIRPIITASLTPWVLKNRISRPTCPR